MEENRNLPQDTEKGKKAGTLHVLVIAELSHT